MEHDVHVIVEDESLRAGFTQIPNLVLRRSDLPPGAKLTYMVLLSYAWQQAQAYPGQDRLADDMGVSERSVRTYLDQLVASGLITIRRRGLGLTNVYVLHRLTGAANIADQARPENISAQDRKLVAAPEVQDFPPKKTQVKKTQVEEDDSNDSNEPDFIISREDTERIAWVMRDISREFVDQAPIKSTATRAVRIFTSSGLPLDEFLDTIQQARLRTKQYTGNIKAERLPDGTKPKMAYLFAVLEELVGLKKTG